MKKKGGLSTILLILIFLAGLSLLLYPSLANYWNSFHASKAISSYAESVNSQNDGENQRMWEEATEYNAEIVRRGGNQLAMTEEQIIQYNRLLSIGGTGIMGYIDIPAIDVELPIYHGTDDAVLQIAVGHLDWTSLPVGGTNTHCVLSGHRGLPSAKLFTNLDKVVEGDVFMLRILDEVLTYEVDQILIVEPAEVEALQIEKGQDYCTLVTCTPYGINTHRLLVRGHRIENTPQAIAMHITAEAMQIDETLVAPVLAMPILLILLIILLLTPKKTKRRYDSL